MRQIAQRRTQNVNGQIGAACRLELEWLRIDLLKVWAAPHFDVDAYARIRYRIRLLIDAARKAGEPPPRAIVSSRSRRKWRQQRRGAPPVCSSFSAARMELVQGADQRSRNSGAAPSAKVRSMRLRFTLSANAHKNRKTATLFEE